MTKQGRGKPNNNRNTTRGGRGYTKNSKSNNQVQKEMKFIPNVTGKPHQATYATVKEALVLYVQEKYEHGSDIARSLEEEAIIDLNDYFPILKESTSTDEAFKQRQNRLLEQEWVRAMNDHRRRENALIENLNKVYALIIKDYCSIGMKNKIEALPNFGDIKNNPIELLKAIKALMNTTVRSQWQFTTFWQVYDRLRECKQYDNEALIEYVKRFKQMKDVFLTYMTEDFVMPFVERQFNRNIDIENVNQNDNNEGSDDITATNTSKIVTATAGCEMAFATLLLQNADKNKYGSLLKDLNKQFSLGHNQFPKTISAAVDVLSQHPFDQKFHDNKRKQKENKTKDDPSPSETSFNQNRVEVTCDCCGKKGHHSNKCFKKNKIPKNEWFINKKVNALQDGTESTLTSSDNNKNNT